MLLNKRTDPNKRMELKLMKKNKRMGLNKHTWWKKTMNKFAIQCKTYHNFVLKASLNQSQ